MTVGQVRMGVLGYRTVTRTRGGVIFTTELARQKRGVTAVRSLLTLCRRSFDRGAIRTVKGLPRPAMRGFTIVAITIIKTDEQFLSRVAHRRGRMGFVDTSLRCDGCAKRTSFSIPCRVLATPTGVQRLCLADYQRNVKYCRGLYRRKVNRSTTNCTAPRKLQGILVVDTAPCR